MNGEQPLPRRRREPGVPMARRRYRGNRLAPNSAPSTRIGGGESAAASKVQRRGRRILIRVREARNPLRDKAEGHARRIPRQRW